MATLARLSRSTLLCLSLVACGQDNQDASAEAHTALGHGDPAVASDADEPPPCHDVEDASPDFARSTVDIVLPPVTLTDQRGEPFPIAALASGGQPLALNFIFATCTTICPVMTATFSQLRKELGADADRVQMVSVTIDPEHDTPQVLAEYAQRHGAPDDWLFLTGSSADVEAVLKATDTWTGSKFNHKPVSLLRTANGTTWTRLEGLGSGAALAAQVRPLLVAEAKL